MAKVVNFPNLKIAISENEREVIYTFQGHVDENFRQEDVPRIKRPSIIFHLADVHNVNSCGIREWVYLVRDISKLSKLIFRECSVNMIDQINMVPDSLGTATIESFFAPYFCECGGGVNRLIMVKEAGELLAAKTAPHFDCERCGKPLEFDALEESYFLFADNVLPQVG
jgi:hypothetical protein